MTNYTEIANRLREIADRQEKMIGLTNPSIDIRQIADELDPPRPEPGTLVWCNHKSWPEDKWEIAATRENGVVLTGYGSTLSWEDIKYKPARILANDEVAVKIDPVINWPEDATHIIWKFEKIDGTTPRWIKHYTVITRAEAEAREAKR